jgi:hypothetical protein
VCRPSPPKEPPYGKPSARLASRKPRIGPTSWLGAGSLFLYNFYQYSTVAGRFASLPRYSQVFAVKLVLAAAINRMKVFGPVSALFGTLALALGGLGLRKK